MDIKELDHLIHSGQFEEADRILEKGIAAGDTDAMGFMGNRLLNGPGQTDPIRAYELNQIAAAAGNTTAMTNLGRQYLFGSGTEKDLDKAVEWLDKAISGGAFKALRYKARYYELEQHDTEKAAECYQKGAEAGDISSQYYLGWLYKNGIGVPQSDERAAYWMSLAESHHNDNAVNSAKNMIRENGGTL